MTATALNTTATVFQFPRPELTVLNTGKKLRKDGMEKQTKNNAKKGRSTAQDPFRNMEDIQKLIAYCDTQLEMVVRSDAKVAWARNKMYFGIGFFSGFRFSDLVSLRWEDILDDDGNYVDRIGIVEQKTGKVKDLVLTDFSKQFIDEYIARVRPDLTGFLFVNRSGKQIGRQGVDDFIKEAASACGIKGNYSTHSIRKTYAYHFYTQMVNDGDEFALPTVQALLNHRNSETTLRYLGITQQKVKERTESFSEHMKENWMA